MTTDLTPYAGRWIALIGDQVTGVGFTAVEAEHAARHSRPKDRFTIRYVEAPGGKQLTLPDLLTGIQPLLAQETQPVYLVGGAVRDALLGRTSQDLDFVTPHDAIKLAFRMANALRVPAYVLDRERDVGRVVLSQAYTYLDFTRFRGPDLEADLYDRDFTINAIALPATAQTENSLIDPTGGQADLQQGIIRHVHKQTLLDDPVRTLRALRLAVSLDFKLAPETEMAVTEAAPHLPQCSNERIRDELLKMLQTAQPDTAVRRLSQLKCLPFILPHIADLVGVSQSPPHHEDVFSHTISVLHWLILVEAGLTAAAEPDSPEIKIIRTQLDPYLPQLQTHWQQVVDGGLDGSILLRLGAMFHDVGKKETQAVEADGRIRFFNHDKIGAKITGQQLRRLALSNQAIGRIQKIVAGHMHPLHLAHAPQSLTRRAVYRYFKATGLAGLDIAILSLADHLATYAGPGDINEWERLLSVVSQLFEHYFNHHEETVAPPPLVNGRDLMQALHLQEGPEIGRLLRLIQEAQAAGEIHTPAEALSLAHRICQY